MILIVDDSDAWMVFTQRKSGLFYGLRHIYEEKGVGFLGFYDAWAISMGTYSLCCSPRYVNDNAYFILYSIHNKANALLSLK